MGNLVESCACKVDFCDKFNQDKTEPNNNTINGEDDDIEEDDDDNLADGQSFGIIKKETKKCYSFKSDIKNMTVKANRLFQHQKANPWDVYKVIEELGSGTYGVVKKVCLINNPETIRALKIIHKDRLIQGVDNEKLLDEIIILKNLDHPNIMKLYEFFEDQENYYMVSEYCDQGDLYGKMLKLYYMNEIVVKFLMEQILNAVAYLHSKGVFHGDIKLENIMLYTTTTRSAEQRFTIINKTITFDKNLQKEINNSFNLDSGVSRPSSKSVKIVKDMLNYEIKLIDFGCSKIFTKRGERTSGIIGTSIYCSPEVIDDLYDEKCDEWACGVLMYLLLCGEPPFQGETEEEIFKNVKKGKYDFSHEEFKNVSENCKNLIKKLLEPKISRRIRAKDALKHPFFTESFNPDAALTSNKDISIIEKLPTLKVPHSQFHRAVVSYMSTNYLSKDEEKKLREVFRYIDYDGQSFLTKAKIEKALKDNGKLITVDKIQNIVDALDIDKNGVIEYQEYIQGLCNKNSLFNDFNLKNVFVIIDTNNKGYLTSTDIINFAFPGKTVDDEAVEEYLKQFGMRIDDKITFDDFAYIIKNNCELNIHDFEKMQSAISTQNEPENDLSLYTSKNDASEMSDNEANGQDKKQIIDFRTPFCLIKK